MKKSIAMILALCVLGGTLFANGQQEAASSSDEARYVIGMSQCNLGEPWRVLTSIPCPMKASPMSKTVS